MDPLLDFGRVAPTLSMARSKRHRWPEAALLILAATTSLISTVVVPTALGLCVVCASARLRALARRPRMNCSHPVSPPPLQCGRPKWGRSYLGDIGLVHECTRIIDLNLHLGHHEDDACTRPPMVDGAPVTVCSSLWNENWSVRSDPSDKKVRYWESCTFYTSDPTARPTAAPTVAPTRAPTTAVVPLTSARLAAASAAGATVAPSEAPAPSIPTGTPQNKFFEDNKSGRKSALGFMIFFGVLSTIAHALLTLATGATLAPFFGGPCSEPPARVVGVFAIGTGTLAVLSFALQLLPWFIWMASPIACGASIDVGYAFIVSVGVSIADVFVLVVVVSHCASAVKLCVGVGTITSSGDVVVM